MRYFVTLFIVFSLLVCLTNSSIAQTPTARIVVKGVSPQLLRDLPSPKPFTTISSGLPNVGRGSNVWLEAKAVIGADLAHTHYDTISALVWRIISQPAGSLTSILYTDTATGLMGLTAVMVPDSLGQYQIGLTVTTANGTSAETATWINASHYVGVGNVIGSATIPECAFCHSAKESDWKQTGHAKIFTYNVDSSDHYSDNCISCHTVGYDKTPTAVNNGFDDVATSLGWHVPVPQVTGNWDTIKANYPAIAKLANIQCENCHGPGSLHLGAIDKNKISANLSAEVCGQCHDRKNGHIKNFEWGQSAHARSVAEGENIEYMNRTACAACHTAQGFIKETIDGLPTAAPYADVEPVTCSACHDPHSKQYDMQLRRHSIAEACTGCHKTRISGFSGLHHAHQGPMLAGSAGTPYKGEAGPIGDWGGWQLPGYQYPNSSHSNIVDKCVDCHMATVGATADTAIIPVPFTQWRNKMGGHTFKVVWDHDTPDDATDDIVNPFGCRECHGVVSREFVEQSQASIHTLLDELRALLPHRTSGDTSAPKFHTDASLSKIQKVGAYNWYFVTNDNSFGVHNHNYAKALLEASIEQLKLGAGAANIASIKDVPNDQGKLVQVVWNKFPAEQFSIDPVISYGVWRNDNVPGATSTIPKVKSFKEMLTAKGTSGSKYSLNGSVWTFVGSVPAAKLTQYGFDASTLYDSTLTGGMKWTTFYVSGHAANPYVVYASMPDSGYSLDNLVPAPPANVGGTIVANAVRLHWDIPADPDVKYIAIYRGTTHNFDPHGTPPVGTATDTTFTDAGVEYGSTYYYKLAAYDFSGNESNYSSEYAIVVLDVGDERGIPREFALKQNYPNPFNPTTAIKYQLAGAAHVRLTIYNTLGVEVARPVDANQEAGYYTIAWSGKDNAGKSVSSGIYLYKIEANSYSSVKKMILMK